MKKCLLVFLAALTSMYALATDYHTLEEIHDRWMSRNIKVPMVSSNGLSKITVEGWEDMDEEAAREKIKSLGQPVVITPKWRKVRLND